jgi:hypothetical protein
MAENKKSFLLYCDLIHTVSKMPKEKAGELFMHILEYVNDMNPETEDLIIQLTFEPIKQSLKRDLKNWQNTVTERSLNGRKGNLKKYNPDIYESYESGKHTLEEAEQLAKTRKASPPDSVASKAVAKVADNVNVNVSVNDKVINKRVVNKFTAPTEIEVIGYFLENGYTEASAKKAFQYYETGNWKDSRGQAVKNWKQKMQSVWFKDENKVVKTFKRIGVNF